MTRMPRWNLRITSAMLLAIICFCSALHSAADDQPLGLQKGDRIVFLGDSITAGGVREGGYVTLIGEGVAKHHADLGIEIIGAGISGNKVPDLQKRLDRDVLDKKPTLVVIYIGINDVWHWNRDAGNQSGGLRSGPARRDPTLPGSGRSSGRLHAQRDRRADGRLEPVR
jgi:lysophospholipase L1-like esterase